MSNELGWNFTADSELQAELAKNMNLLAKQFDEKITELYNKIDSMGSEKHWIGEDYDAFKNGCEGYKGALKDLSRSFRMFANHLYKISDGTIEYANEINNRETEEL